IGYTIIIGDSMHLPTITTQQQAILTLLYRHRFLERKHVQQFLGHQDYRRCAKWLKDLREKGCIDWLYDPGGSSERSKPAVFFLGTNGIRLMRRLGRFPESELRKRYKDRVQQQSFMTRSLLIADCCLQLEAHSKDEGDSLQYSYTLPADYADQDSEIYDAYGNEA